MLRCKKNRSYHSVLLSFFYCFKLDASSVPSHENVSNHQVVPDTKVSLKSPLMENGRSEIPLEEFETVFTAAFLKNDFVSLKLLCKQARTLENYFRNNFTQDEKKSIQKAINRIIYLSKSIVIESEISQENMHLMRYLMVNSSIPSEHLTFDETVSYGFKTGKERIDFYYPMAIRWNVPSSLYKARGIHLFCSLSKDNQKKKV